jgi:2,3-bisphosphoglycerate-independent phosphoglycerate mutase
VVEVLLILDGASEPMGDAPTSLERARTPLLDRLARAGRLERLRTVRPGLPAGSETAVPALLGWAPEGPVDRGALEAAARGIEPGPGRRAWRVDVRRPDGSRADDRRAAHAVHTLRAYAPRHQVVRLSGHRLLAWGRPPLPELPPGLEPWPEGGIPPEVLDRSVVFVAAKGAAAGIARLMGARVIVPVGATGGTDTYLPGKAEAAARAAAEGASRVVVHVAAADEAAHELDPDAKAEAIERVDDELLPELVELVRDCGGVLHVCPDHGCDPHTGRHDSAPVPSLQWTADQAERPVIARLTERAVAALPLVDTPALAGAT